MNFNTQPTLENDLLILRPLKPEDLDQLFAVAADPLIWEQHPEKNRCDRSVFEVLFRDALSSKGALVAIDKKMQKVRETTTCQYQPEFRVFVVGQRQTKESVNNHRLF